MSEREQFSWVWLGSLILFYGSYFIAIAALEAAGEVSVITRLGLLAGAAAASGLAIGVNALLARSRREPGEPVGADERDRSIRRHARSVAYGVLLTGMILVGCLMPFGATEWEMVQAAILAIVIAELTHHGVVVASYRRGWRV